jgi:hypothetical protein
MGKKSEHAFNAYEVKALFPLADNDGLPFEEDVWGWWRDEMTKLQLAFTETGVVQGFWEGQSERHRSVFWIVASMTEVRKIRAFVAAAKLKFQQKEMFFEYFPVRYEGI